MWKISVTMALAFFENGFSKFLQVISQKRLLNLLQLYILSHLWKWLKIWSFLLMIRLSWFIWLFNWMIRHFTAAPEIITRIEEILKSGSLNIWIILTRVALSRMFWTLYIICSILWFIWFVLRRWKATALLVYILFLFISYPAVIIICIRLFLILNNWIESKFTTFHSPLFLIHLFRNRTVFLHSYLLISYL